MVDFLKEQVFLIISAKVLHKSIVLSPNWVDVNRLFQPSTSSPDGPAHFECSFSQSIEGNLIRCTSSGLFGNNTSGSTLRLDGCFGFNCSNVFSCYLSEIWLRYGLKFFKILLMLLQVFRHLWIISTTFTNSTRSPYSRSSILFPRALGWSFDSDFLKVFEVVDLALPLFLLTQHLLLANIVPIHSSV